MPRHYKTVNENTGKEKTAPDEGGGFHKERRFFIF